MDEIKWSMVFKRYKVSKNRYKVYGIRFRVKEYIVIDGARHKKLAQGFRRTVHGKNELQATLLFVLSPAS
jgi:hypothetical protein